MRYSLGALWLTLVLLIFPIIVAHGQSYSIPETNIENINIPDEYFVCDREKCDRGFEKILKSQNLDFEEWKKAVMIPGDIYLYAMKEEGSVLYVKSEAFTEITFSMYQTDDKDEYGEVTKLAYDYKLISDTIARESALKKYRYNITSTGVQDKDIDRISWIDNGQKECIPYLLCSYKDDGVYMADYHTVFNGCKLSVTVTEEEPISTEKLMKLSDVITSMEYSQMPDYTEAKVILKEKREKDLALKKEVYDDAKRIQFIFGFFISLMLSTAIYIDSKRMLSKKQYDVY